MLTSVIASSAAIGQVASTPARQELVSSGVDRYYLLHVPVDHDGADIPLVINFHGSLLVPEDQVKASDFGTIADREGFAVAYPAGAFASGNMQRSWNADVEDSGVDDVQFVRDIVEDVAKRLNVDRSRIYATGFSGGGRISSRLACELSDLLAAAAPVAGLQYYADCTPAQPIPILAIHSTADPFNHYKLSDDSPAYWHVGVETAIEKWQAANGCETPAEVSDFADSVERRTWSDCRGGSEITLYAVDDDKHMWPGFASEVVWEFFSRH
jgi:polyhydroxybutyrate depolymerase